LPGTKAPRRSPASRKRQLGKQLGQREAETGAGFEHHPNLVGADVLFERHDNPHTNHSMFRSGRARDDFSLEQLTFAAVLGESHQFLIGPNFDGGRDGRITATLGGEEPEARREPEARMGLVNAQPFPDGSSDPPRLRIQS
jgi:hypothetical protein